MKSNVFVDYILRAKDMASKAFSRSGDKANYYRESMKNASYESFKFGRMQDSVVQPSVAVSTSRLGWMTKAVKGLGLAFLAGKAFMLFFRDGIQKTSSTLGEMAHKFSSNNDSLAASAQLTGKSREEIAKYREMMIDTAQEVRKMDIAIGEIDWQNALFGLLNAGIRDIDVIKDLSKESMILGKALRIDPEITSKAMAQWRLQLNLSNEDIKELAGTMVLLRKQGFKITEQSITTLDNKMKSFVGKFGPSHLKDIYAIRGALDKYGASQSLLDSILDTSTGNLEAFKAIMIQSGVALSKHDQDTLNLALQNGDLETSFQLMMKSMPKLIEHLGGAGPAADQLAEAFHISREEALSMSDAIPKVQQDLSEAFANIDNSSRVMNASRLQAIEATQNWRSRLNSIFHSVWDPSIVTMDKFILKMTKLIPASATKNIRDFFTDAFDFTDTLFNKTKLLITLWNKSDTKVALLKYWEKFDNKSIVESMGIMFDDIVDKSSEFATKAGIDITDYWKKFDDKTAIQSFRKITNDFGTIAISFLRGKGKEFKDWWVEIGKGIDKDNVSSSFDYIYLKVDKLVDEYSPKIDLFFAKFKDKTLSQSAIILFDELNAGIDTFIAETMPKIKKWWVDIGKIATERDMGGELVNPLFNSLYTNIDRLLDYGPKIALWWKEFDSGIALNNTQEAFDNLLGVLESMNTILKSIVSYGNDVKEFFSTDYSAKDYAGYATDGVTGIDTIFNTAIKSGYDKIYNGLDKIANTDLLFNYPETSKKPLQYQKPTSLSEDWEAISRSTTSVTNDISSWFQEVKKSASSLFTTDNIERQSNPSDITRSLASSLSNDITKTMESISSFFSSLSSNISNFVVPEANAAIVPVNKEESSDMKHSKNTLNNNLSSSIDALNKVISSSIKAKDPEVNITNRMNLDAVVEAINKSNILLKDLSSYMKKSPNYDQGVNNLRYNN